MLDGGRLRGGRRSSPGVRVDGRRRKPHNVPHAREH
jgi:hypothetical protein